MPLTTATSEEGIFRLYHYSNLQLLKIKDNLNKKDKLDWKSDGEKNDWLLLSFWREI